VQFETREALLHTMNLHLARFIGDQVYFLSSFFFQLPQHTLFEFTGEYISAHGPNEPIVEIAALIKNAVADVCGLTFTTRLPAAPTPGNDEGVHLRSGCLQVVRILPAPGVQGSAAVQRTKTMRGKLDVVVLPMYDDYGRPWKTVVVDFRFVG
jgi:hypothetical protein